MTSVVHKSSVLLRVFLPALLIIHLPSVRATDLESRKPAAMPMIYLDTTIVASRGQVRTVSDQEDFQAALDAASPGDTIELPAGVTFVGNFTLPSKPGAEADASWITIQSSALDDLPPAGTRLAPSMAAALPKLASNSEAPVVSAAQGAHHYRFVGIEFTLADGNPFSYGLIRLGEGDETDAASLPHDIIIDRCYIHGNETASLRRGVALNGASIAVTDSYIADCHESGADSQALCGWNGPGPFKIVNNYLEAAGENVMFGGADPKIPNLIPSDIEFRRNYCRKPLAWKAGDPQDTGRNWSVKNLLELKNAQRVLIEGNLFENTWLDAQTGYAILFKSVNQEGTAPWSSTQDVLFSNNIVRHCGGGINIEGRSPDQPGGQTSRIDIENNLFDDLNGQAWGGDGCFLKISESRDVVVNHNTVIQSGNIITAYGKPNTGFVFTNTVAARNLYGIKGDGTSEGNSTLEMFFPDLAFKKNVIAGVSTSAYPRKTFVVASLDDVGFVDLANGDYHLASQSPCKNAGTKGTDIGADIDAIYASQ
jgi:hypothetical protein